MGTRYAGDDNDSYFDDLFLKVWQDADCMNTGMLGDLNQDEILNILDIIIMVNIILELDDYESLADMNEDGIVNILDVITLINAILEH
jgi:molybdenum cofactor biosynthesis enzyme MoaA